MNFLKTLWSWLLKLMRCSPRMPVSISDLEKQPLDADCCEEECEPEEDCCDHDDCEPEEECCEEECEPEEDCCDHEDCEPEEELPEIEEVEELPAPDPVEELVVPPIVSTPAGELLRKILLAEGINETVIRKYGIVEAFEGWYEGVLDDASVRESIQDFKAAQGGVIKAKLSRVQ